MKRLIIIFSITCLAAFGLDGSVKAEAASVSELTQLIQEQKDIKDQYHQIADIARGLGLAENHPIITSAQKEWKAANQKQNEYKSELNKWSVKEKEYPHATYVWNYLKDNGFNDYVAAGIMGNLMAETGGQTLNIQPYLWSNGYYGICMWSLYYCDVGGYSLAQQCDYLKTSMVKEFNNFGFCYYSGFNYYGFTQMRNTQDAAVAFAKCYERCDSGSYYVRQSNAEKAYRYFVG